MKPETIKTQEDLSTPMIIKKLEDKSAGVIKLTVGNESETIKAPEVKLPEPVKAP
jgi:hypothetical protein